MFMPRTSFSLLRKMGSGRIQSIATQLTRLKDAQFELNPDAEFFQEELLQAVLREINRRVS